MTFTDILITDMEKYYKTDKIQPIQYNILCPKVTISPQKLKVGSIPQVKALIMYKLIMNHDGGS